VVFVGKVDWIHLEYHTIVRLACIVILISVIEEYTKM